MEALVHNMTELQQITKWVLIERPPQTDHEDMCRLARIVDKVILYVDSKQRGLSTEQYDYEELLRALEE